MGGSAGVAPKVHAAPYESGDGLPYALSAFSLDPVNWGGGERQVRHHFFSSSHLESSQRRPPSSFVVHGGPFRLYRGHDLPGDYPCLCLRGGAYVRNRDYGVLCLRPGHDNGPCFDCGGVRDYDYRSALGLVLDDFRPFVL